MFENSGSTEGWVKMSSINNSNWFNPFLPETAFMILFGLMPDNLIRQREARA